MDNCCFEEFEENDDNINMPPDQRMAKMLCAIAPHLPPKIRGPLMMAGKVMELMAIINAPPPPPSDDSCFEPDMEAMIKSMRHFCSKKERQMFDQLSSMMSAMKMLHTFQEMSSMMGGLNPEGGGGNPFDALFSFMGNGSAESGCSQTDIEMPAYSDTYIEPCQYDNSNFESADYEKQSFHNEYCDGEYTAEIPDCERSTQASDTGSSQMFETLSSMLTPEQQSMLQMMKGMMDSGMFPTK